MITRERTAAVALLLVGLGAVYEASRLTIGHAGQPGPGFFPLWLALGLSAVALTLLLRSLATPPRHLAVAAERPRHRKVGLALVAGVGYTAALEALGFVLTTFLFLLFLLTVVEPRRPTSSLAIAATTALVCYLVFKVWLDVQLPAGPWGF